MGKRAIARMKFTFKAKPRAKRLRMDLDEAAGSDDDGFKFDSDEDVEAKTAAALAAVAIPDDKIPGLGRSLADRTLLATAGAYKKTKRDWEPQRPWKKQCLMPNSTRGKPWGKMDDVPRQRRTTLPVSRLSAAGRTEGRPSIEGRLVTSHLGRLYAPTVAFDSTRRKPCKEVGNAATIIRKGGLDIQRQSTEWVYYHGEMHVGCAMWTTAGKLSSRFIIHAVGPDARHHRWPTQSHQLDLRRTVRSALMVADGLGVTSITMPAISTGPGRYPKYLAAQEIVAECLKFIDDYPATTMRLIVLMNEDEVTTSIFTQTLKEEKLQRQLQG
ncbi:hypothetical protein ON010_g8588 [Phytophthora cinnamomi]|nr:hypothetical protein ON010_g8588 [Phytophthora cinnamomi]